MYLLITVSIGFLCILAMVYYLYADALDDAKTTKSRLLYNLGYFVVGASITFSTLLLVDGQLNMTCWWHIPAFFIAVLPLIFSFGLLNGLSVVLMIGSVLDFFIVLPIELICNWLKGKLS